MLTVYCTSEYDMSTLINQLPKYSTSLVIDSWTSEKTYQVSEKNSEGNFEMVSEKKKQYHGVLLIYKATVNPLKKYVRFQIHKNVYPRDFQDETCLYVKMNQIEKIEIQRLFEAFSKATGSKIPKYIPKNGFGFYQFEKNDKNFIPTILGMLRNYPSLNGATLKYAIKKGQNRNKLTHQKENSKIILNDNESDNESKK